MLAYHKSRDVKMQCIRFDNLETHFTQTQAKHNKYAQYLENEISKPSQSVSDFKRISMAFTDNNYEFIFDETSRLGINCAHFLNSLIRIMDSDEVDKYVESQPFRKGNNAIKRKGHPAKRIKKN